MELIKRILSITIFILPVVFGALAHADDTYQGGTVTQPLGNVFTTPNALASTSARVTFYRPPVGSVSGATGIEIDGRYHTSLQPGSYTEVCLAAPAKPAVSTRWMETGQAIKNDLDTTKTLELRAAQNTFVRVTDLGNGRATFDVVALDVAKKELRQTNRQIHAVSRVPVVSCEQQARPFVAARAVETITLGSDALFGFGKSNIESIVPYGRQELDRLIARLKTRYGNFDNMQVEIVGHADPIGEAEVNQRLSAARAQTIQNYMIGGGIDRNKITSEGVGETQPVVTHCSRVATPQSIACNKPNRRVVVAVSVLTR